MSKNKIDEICVECGSCSGIACKSLNDDMKNSSVVPHVIPEKYSNGIRFTCDAADCSLPISIDSHLGCTYSCLYCFSNNLMRAPDKNPSIIKRIIESGNFYSQYPVKSIERFLNRDLKGVSGMDKKTLTAMYKLLDDGLPVQLGALGDPFDDLEATDSWAKKVLPLFIKYKVPVRISTKGGKLLQQKQYLKIFEKAPENFWFAFSIICNDDDLISKVDIGAPVTSERLKAMKLLTSMGCSASLRFRPFIPGISDSYEGEPKAWKTLIDRSKKAGAKAISFEYLFLDSVPTKRLKAMYNLLFRVAKKPNFDIQWNSMSKKSESCRRGNREFKYQMTMDIRKEVHKLNMVFGISDPHFKEYNDTGSCCGIKDDDPVFGKWSRQQLTNVIVNLHKSKKDLQVRFEDWCPEWAKNINANKMMSFRDWHGHRRKKDMTFADFLRNNWNSPRKPRSPFGYFGDVFYPIGIDPKTGDLVYKYKKWRKQ